MRSRNRGAVWAALPLVLLFACSDGGPLHPHEDAVTVPLQLSANLNGTPVQTLAVEVTAADISTPLAYNLQVTDGQASGSIQIPPGDARTITVRAFDVAGAVTHEGAATVNVSRGNNPPVQIPLLPRSGHQPIDLTLAEVSVTVTPVAVSLASGETAQLAATVIAAGGPVDVDVGWATLNPAIASVSADGLVTGLVTGTVTIVATYAGVGAAATVTVNPTLYMWFIDADGDSFGDPATGVLSASQPAGYIAAGSDCDDTDPSVHPYATEVAGDGIDNDCNGTVDDAPMSYWYRDADGDGFGDPAVWILGYESQAGFVADATDCHDGDATVHPGAPEVADGLDNDCDGLVDEGGEGVWHADNDGDGYGDPTNWFFGFQLPGYVADATDCHDGDPTVNPGAPEVVGDGLDNNCDGVVDEGMGLLYADSDGDGYGDPNNWILGFNLPGYVEDGSDCNDANAGVNPGAPEVAGDGVDNDCDTLIDEL